MQGKISVIDENDLGAIENEVEYSDVYSLAGIISADRPYAPGSFTSRRAIKTLSNIQLLVLDVDDGCDLSEAISLFKDFKHIIATSKSHQKEKNGVVCDRFRVVLFLDSLITTDADFKATWHTAHKRWPFIDEACKDSSRFFYPSPEIISINDTGRDYPVSVAALPTAPALVSPTEGQSGGVSTLSSFTTKGELSKRTLKFLLEGAPAGERHKALVWAVPDMKEQGYDLPEILEKLENMTQIGDWTQPSLSHIDLKTINTMYARETKYPPRPGEEPKKDFSVIVNASELLEETFSYLADKDKVKGDSTGVDGLDGMLGGGFRTGELTVLMAQAKTGKNTLYHDLIYRQLCMGVPVGYASRELNPASEVIPNLLSIALQKNAWTADISDIYQTDARNAMKNWSLYFAPGYGYFPIEKIVEWFTTLKEQGVNHFLFDHFHYALLGEDYDATAKLIKELKSLTKSLDIHLSLIVQPRSLREGETLSLATLRGGAAIGQALDNLLILERVKGETNISKLTLEVARHKLAKLGSIYLMYDSNTTTFVEVDKTVMIENPMPQGIEPRGSKYNDGNWPRLKN